MLNAIKNLLGLNNAKEARATGRERRSLKDELLNVIETQFKKMPKAGQDANLNQIKKLKDAKADAEAVRAPSDAPAFALPGYNDASVELESLLKKGPVVLSFYRGRWCPFCNTELQALKRTLADFKSQGATLVAISPMTIEQVRESAEGSSPDFEVVSDPGNAVARQYGLVYEVDPELSGAFNAFGLNLKTMNGDDEELLPIPATYVVAPDGKIVYSYVDPDFTRRAEPADVLAALKSINAQN